MSAQLALKELKNLSDPERARHAQRYFKTGKGDYGEGDQFVGVTVPNVRKLAKQHSNLDFIQTEKLLQSNIHEARLLALIILVEQFKRARKQKNESLCKSIFEFYSQHLEYINNWDLVDTSCRDIVGGYLLLRRKANRKVLTQWARSDNLWHRRIAIIATSAFINQQQFDDTLKLAKQLLKDEHDLIHKAVGWMLREVGKQDRAVLDDFLEQHHFYMPRTMLRYAIEKYPEKLRQQYLTKNPKR